MKTDSSRVEFIAIPVVLVVLGVLFALMLAADTGVWAWLVLVVGLLVLAGVGIAAAARRRQHPPALHAPATTPAGPASSGDYRVLVIADETLEPETFQTEIAPHAAARPVEALVIAPALRSRLAHWTGDDSEREQAEARLAQTLEGLEAAGIRARGEVGSDDPIQAADDGLRAFPANEVVFVTGGGDANWLEQGVIEAARKRYDLRVTHVET